MWVGSGAGRGARSAAGGVCCNSAGGGAVAGGGEYAIQASERYGGARSGGLRRGRGWGPGRDEDVGWRSWSGNGGSRVEAIGDLLGMLGWGLGRGGEGVAWVVWFRGTVVQRPVRVSDRTVRFSTRSRSTVTPKPGRSRGTVTRPSASIVHSGLTMSACQ